MAALITIIRSNWIIITLLLLAVVTLLSLTPVPTLSVVPDNDKVQHAIAYAVLTFPVVLTKRKYWLWIGLFFIAWSGGIELLQPYFNHHRDWLDLLANGTGIVCGTLFALFINWIFPTRLKHK